MITIWTWGYRPFILGGKVVYPLACEVEGTGPYPLGKGFEGYLVVAPNGRTFVAEASTGALIGPSLDDVRQDTNKGNKAYITKQIKDAAAELPNLERVDSTKFWKMLKCEV